MPNSGIAFGIQDTQTLIIRRYVHLFFLAVCVCLVVAMVSQLVTIFKREQLALQLASVPATLKSIDASDAPAAAHQDNNHPMFRLALGTALARGNNLEQAEHLLNELARSSDDNQIRIAAEYNLANAYLRQALATGSETSSQSLPLVELSKQRYRDLLREEPQHWSARYNLERALILAPEGTDRNDDERIEPVKSVDVIVPGFEKQDLP